MKQWVVSFTQRIYFVPILQVHEFLFVKRRITEKMTSMKSRTTEFVSFWKTCTVE